MRRLLGWTAALVPLLLAPAAVGAEEPEDRVAVLVVGAHTEVTSRLRREVVVSLEKEGRNLLEDSVIIEALDLGGSPPYTDPTPQALWDEVSVRVGKAREFLIDEQPLMALEKLAEVTAFDSYPHGLFAVRAEYDLTRAAALLDREDLEGAQKAVWEALQVRPDLIVDTGVFLPSFVEFVHAERKKLSRVEVEKPPLPAGTVVWIDGLRMKEDTASITPTTHWVVADAPGYGTVQQDVRLEDGGELPLWLSPALTESLSVDLLQLVQTGSANIRVRDALSAIAGTGATVVVFLHHDVPRGQLRTLVWRSRDRRFYRAQTGVKSETLLTLKAVELAGNAVDDLGQFAPDPRVAHNFSRARWRATARTGGAHQYQYVHPHADRSLEVDTQSTGYTLAVELGFRRPMGRGSLIGSAAFRHARFEFGGSRFRLASNPDETFEINGGSASGTPLAIGYELRFLGRRLGVRPDLELFIDFYTPDKSSSVANVWLFTPVTVIQFGFAAVVDYLVNSWNVGLVARSGLVSGNDYTSAKLGAENNPESPYFGAAVFGWYRLSDRYRVGIEGDFLLQQLDYIGTDPDTTVGVPTFDAFRETRRTQIVVSFELLLGGAR